MLALPTPSTLILVPHLASHVPNVPLTSVLPPFRHVADDRTTKWTHILDYFPLYAEKSPAKVCTPLRAISHSIVLVVLCVVSVVAEAARRSACGTSATNLEENHENKRIQVSQYSSKGGGNEKETRIFKPIN